MMTWSEYQKLVDGQTNKTKIEAYIAISDEMIRQAGGDHNAVPDGGEWKDSAGNGRGIVKVASGSRWAFRNYCEFEEVTLPNGQTGVYVHAHAPDASRFR